MKTERLRLKFIVCTMAVVTAAVLLSMAAALLAGGHMRRDLFRIQLMTCSVIWSCALVFSLFFSRWAAGPAERRMRYQKRAVADVSHELKTPLTVITADAALLKENCHGICDDWDRWLDHMDEECRQMTALLESIMSLAKSEEMSRSRKYWKDFNLSRAVTEKILLFEPLFYQMGKEISWQIEKNLSVRGNETQIGQVIQVLLDNSAKYTPEGWRTQVILERISRNSVRLWVNSQGKPIPSETKERIFCRYYRAEEAAGRKGCGLGLSIAGDIIHFHGGRAGVEYKDGMNCFYVILKTRQGEIRKTWESLYKAQKSCV